jgi:hypothetical protein
MRYAAAVCVVVHFAVFKQILIVLTAVVLGSDVRAGRLNKSAAANGRGLAACARASAFEYRLDHPQQNRALILFFSFTDASCCCSLRVLYFCR